MTRFVSDSAVSFISVLKASKSKLLRRILLLPSIREAFKTAISCFISLVSFRLVWMFQRCYNSRASTRFVSEGIKFSFAISVLRSGKEMFEQ